MKKIFLFLVVLLSIFTGFSQAKIQVTTGSYHVLALKDGVLFGWGDNGEGQLGNGTKSLEYAPIKISGQKEWKQVSAAAMHSLGIQKDGSLWAWGWGNNHEMGLGQRNSRSLVPVRVGRDTNWARVSTSAGNTVASKTDGTLWVWGNNVGAALGVGPTPNSAVYVPTRVGKDNDWAWAIATQHMTFGIKKNGTLWSWGRKGGSDVRGYSSAQDVTTSPTQIGKDNDWKELFVHQQHARAAVIGLKKDGSVWVWGQNQAGKLGLGDDTYRLEPAPLNLNGQWLSFGIAQEYSLAVNGDGNLWQSGSYLKWTDAKAGEKNASKIFQRSKITGRWRSVHMLQNQAVVLVSETGDVYAYGINARGELGQGIKGGSWTPLLVKLINP